MGKIVRVIEQDGYEIQLEHSPNLHITAEPPTGDRRGWSVRVVEECDDPEVPPLVGYLATGLTGDEAAVVVDALTGALLPKPIVDIPKIIERYRKKAGGIQPARTRGGG